MTEANVTKLDNEHNCTNSDDVLKNVTQENVTNKLKDDNANATSNTAEIAEISPNTNNCSLPTICSNSSDHNLTQLENENNNNTVSKYVLNIKDKKSAAEKQNGHYKNSLLREKRSQEALENIDAAPANDKYIAIPNPGKREELPDPEAKQAVINSANLADFNIETLHVNEGAPVHSLQSKSQYTNTPQKFKSYARNDASSENSGISGESDSKSNSHENSPSSRNYKSSDSNESSEITDDLSVTPLASDIYDRSRENIKVYPKKNTNDESSEARDNFNSSEESKENTASYPKRNSNSKPYSNVDSSESNENKANFSYDSKESEDLRSNITGFYVNQRHNKPEYKENQNSNEYASAENSSSQVKDSTGSYNKAEKIKDDVRESGDSSHSSETGSFDNKTPISINDEEIKPVVELKSESSEESNEELHEAPNSKLRNENDGSQTLDKVKDDGKADVKQQFERIPLNYNHDADKTNKTEVSDAKQIISTENDETIQTTPKFDENLYFKFGDISVTLPEIKLPEDILDFATESPSVTENGEENDYFLPYKNKERKQENSDEKSNDKTPVYYDDYTSFTKDDKPQKNSKYNDYDDRGDEDEDDEDDLYEKFVRERFGRRGSFQKRSEKLVKEDPIIENKKLYNTLQNVLKKTQEIQKEADKNGKPQGDYLWTLEYGQNLR